MERSLLFAGEFLWLCQRLRDQQFVIAALSSPRDEAEPFDARCQKELNPVLFSEYSVTGILIRPPSDIRDQQRIVRAQFG